ncbi:MAG: hypothetical protein M3503_04105 [Actinomycetota bacterium]|nr:hypothetical protein [Actinomycetota bacterium]
MEGSVGVATEPSVLTEPRPSRPSAPADVFMRRLLRVPEQSPPGSAAAARSAFTTSLAFTTVRCLLTYIILPVLGPVIGFTGTVGPLLGLVVGSISAAAIVVSMRRFWKADHRMRWAYTAIGAAIIVLLAVQAIGDVGDLAA